MKKTISKLIMFIGLLCFIPNVSYAQSASESYNKGVALMNKGDYQEAIASFQGFHGYQQECGQCEEVQFAD